MARTPFTVQQLTGPYPASLVMDSLTWAAADLANGNSFAFTGKEIIIVRNDDAATKNITLTSVVDPYGRSVNVTKAILTGEYAIFQASDLTGWIQTDGLFYLSGDDVDLFIAVVRLA